MTERSPGTARDTSMDFRYRPRDGSAVRAMLWLASPGDEAPLRSYAETHGMQSVMTGSDAATVLRAARAGEINLVLVWRVERLGDHPLCAALADLRDMGVEFMSVLEL